jgi:hypothetical protein
MVTVEIKLDEKRLRQIEKSVAHIPGAMSRIVPASLNRTAASLRTRAARAVAAQMGSRVGDARRQIRIERARRSWWSAIVMIEQAMIPLIVLEPVQRPSGVTYRQGKTRALRAGAFVQTMPSGHVGVFRRRGQARLPIKEQYERLLDILDTGFMRPLNEQAATQLAKNIASRVRWQLEKARGR